MGKVKRYVPKRFVYAAREVKDEKFALSQYGQLPVCSDEMLLTDLCGNEQPETKEHLEERYIQVEIDERELKIDKDDMANAYASMSVDWNTSSEESETYIKGTKDIHSIK